ncbi:1-acyl-sn-glycerol-3-phosphate acyltransferase [Dehalococcoidia bacterium]|nr:1-acyl-sn-glycerol-3-phosphate acyltransferase [Dehalococcoidia bacterium]
MILFYAVATATMKTLLFSLTRWEVKGRENVPRNGPLIVVANHLSLIDPPLLSASVPRRVFFMAKEELFSSWGAAFVRWFGAFPVRRGTLDRKALRQAMQVLERGQTLGMFPEGKRSLNQQMNEAEFGIAMIAYSFKGQGKRVILAAADTFRAAAIDQLKHWGDRLGIEVISSQPGGDPGAVVFDALEAARRRKADVLIADTAGRIQTRFNLMEELKKIRRVITRAGVDPVVLLVLDANTGQNGLSQARYFAEAIGVDGVIIAKLDSTSRGGIVLSIVDQLKIPILFIGTGQEPDDLAPFRADEFVESLLSR